MSLIAAKKNRKKRNQKPRYNPYDRYIDDTTYDSVELRVDDALDILYKINDGEVSDQELSNLFITPAIKYLKIILDDTIGMLFMPPLKVKNMPPDRIMDVYVYRIKNGINTNAIVYDIRGRMGENNVIELSQNITCFTHTDQNNVSMEKDPPVKILGFYMAVQYALTHRPDAIQTKTDEPTAHHTKTKASKSRQPSKINIGKRYVISRGIMDKTPHKKHEMTCPSWSVAGHWRTYKKTGKRVWIEGYKKGKDKETVAPAPKTYYIQNKGSDET